MLVLSRRKNEEICFPELGISIKVVQINGKSTRLAIDAPTQVQILRGEIQPKKPATPTTSHELRNRLNELTLAIQLYKRQQENGTADNSDKIAQKISETLNQLHKDIKPEQTDSGYQILIVEDNANERELLSTILKWNGANVITAGDGEEALEKLRAGLKPDFVLMDMRMPRLDGQQTIQQIRSSPELRNVPVFAMSGTPESEFATKTGPDGFNDWFAKPLNPNQLWERIQRQVDNNKN